MMAETNMQEQINDINSKLDLILQYVDQQRLKTQEIEDLVKDVSIVSKDVFNSTVAELENQNIELDTDQLKMLLFKLVKNIGNLNQTMSMFESLNDLVKDLGPVFTSVGLDLIAKIAELEKKGYLEFFRESGKIIDNIVSHYTADDVKALADNVVTIMDTVKSLTQPDLLNTINNAIKIYGSIDMDNIPQYSMFKLIREMNKPEMRRGLGFIAVFMKNIASQENTKSLT